MSDRLDQEELDQEEFNIIIHQLELLLPIINAPLPAGYY